MTESTHVWSFCQRKIKSPPTVVKNCVFLVRSTVRLNRQAAARDQGDVVICTRSVDQLASPALTVHPICITRTQVATSPYLTFCYTLSFPPLVQQCFSTMDCRVWSLYLHTVTCQQNSFFCKI